MTEVYYTDKDFDTVKKFDAHVHNMVTGTEFIDIAEKDKFQILSIMVDYPGAFPALSDQSKIMHTLHTNHSSVFKFATTFSMFGFEAPGWAAWANNYVDWEVTKGALAVKIWKNVGMVERRDDGQLIFIDDKVFDPIIKHLEEKSIPLIAHQGEPWDCWQAFANMISYDDIEYYTQNPQYYMHDKTRGPKSPTYAELMTYRDKFLTNHKDDAPKLNFIGAHIASLEYNIDVAAAFLEKYQNATIDLAARMSALIHQAHTSTARYNQVRDFFMKYRTRILYGTDLEYLESNKTKFRDLADKMWRFDWNYLATDATQPFIDAKNGGEDKVQVKGLKLPKEVIDDIYYNNAYRVFNIKK